MSSMKSYKFWITCLLIATFLSRDVTSTGTGETSGQNDVGDSAQDDKGAEDNNNVNPTQSTTTKSNGGLNVGDEKHIDVGENNERNEVYDPDRNPIRPPQDTRPTKDLTIPERQQRYDYVCGGENPCKNRGICTTEWTIVYNNVDYGYGCVCTDRPRYTGPWCKNDTFIWGIERRQVRIGGDDDPNLSKAERNNRKYTSRCTNPNPCDNQQRCTVENSMVVEGREFGHSCVCDQKKYTGPWCNVPLG